MLERFLREILKNSGKDVKNYRIAHGKNGFQVKYPEAREASGDYPRIYMTESYFESIQGQNMFPRGWSPEVKVLEQGDHYDQEHDYEALGISVRKGIRGTTDQPKLWSRTLMFFGGSTTFGFREVPDDLTFASFVQRKINLDFGGIRVINHGQSGATVIDRVGWLIKETPTRHGDLVVFYFGANDCGWHVHGMSNGREQDKFQSPLLIVLGRFINRRIELLNWLHGELALRHNKWCADNTFKATVVEFQKAKKWAENRGLNFLVVLQPHIYVSQTTSHYEESLRGRFSFFLRDQLRIAYPRYEEFVKNCGYGVSLTHIFDNLQHSVYLDWCHVNARGNEIVAENLFYELKNRNWL